MKCISVYTGDFAVFSDICEQIIDTPLADEEEKVIDGVTVFESGEVPDHYLQRMKSRSDVVVMKIKERDITILQHDGIFEIILPDNELAGSAKETVIQ
jgi:precorrin-4 methylase